ncbi:MAG: TetR/AcrR family transcriptional regulator [Sarcina sp.]
MPKIIKNIEMTILEESAKVFSVKGYNGSDMKAIANACGIAVGTLYNYYPNKKMLYKDVFLKSWNITIKKLEGISTENNQHDQLIKQIKILYKEIEKRNGIGIDFRELCKKGSQDFDEVAREILEMVINVTLKKFEIKKEFKNLNEIYIKIMIIWITSQFALITDFPNGKEENVMLLYNTISNFFILD